MAGTWSMAGAPLTAALTAFGGAATFTPSGGAAEPVDRVIVDEGYRVTQIDGDGLPVNATQTRLSVRVTDLSRRPRREDRFAVAGVVYHVESVEDGTSGDAICVVQRVGG